MLGNQRTQGNKGRRPISLAIQFIEINHKVCTDLIKDFLAYAEGFHCI